MPYTLRALLAEQLAAASLLLVETNANLPAAEVEADLRRSWTTWPSLQIGAFLQAHLVGLVAGRVDGADAQLGWSDDIVLKRHQQGQGLGGRLLGAQLAAFRALGCTRVRGLSPESLADKISFFERYGFRVVGEEIAHGLWGVREGERVFVTERLLSVLD